MLCDQFFIRNRTKCHREYAVSKVHLRRKSDTINNDIKYGETVILHTQPTTVVVSVRSFYEGEKKTPHKTSRNVCVIINYVLHRARIMLIIGNSCWRQKERHFFIFRYVMIFIFIVINPFFIIIAVVISFYNNVRV